MDDPISIKREVHGLLQKMGSGAIDMSPAEAQKILVDVRDRQHSLESVFSELEMKKAHVTGQYEADFTPPWFGKWREKVHANRFSGYPAVSLLRHEVYSQDGTPNETRAYVRTTEPPFPMMVTVSYGPGIYSSYRPDFALGYAHAYVYEGKKYKLMLKVRVDPAILTKLTCHNPDEHGLPREYRVPDKGYIRPVAVCVYTVK